VRRAEAPLRGEGALLVWSSVARTATPAFTPRRRVAPWGSQRSRRAHAEESRPQKRRCCSWCWRPPVCVSLTHFRCLRLFRSAQRPRLSRRAAFGLPKPSRRDGCQTNVEVDESLHLQPAW